MQAVHLAGSIFYALKILPARGTRPNKNNNKKMDTNSWKKWLKGVQD